MSGGVPETRPVERDRWLESRLDGVPPRLAEALRAMSSDPGAEALAADALAAFERVATGGRRRAGALELLAADALLTYAFEAAADREIGGSAASSLELAQRVGAEIRARLVDVAP